MTSRERRNTSKSGGSRKSTTKPAKSRATRNTSTTQPASFEQVFGKGPTPEVQRWTRLLEAARWRHQLLLEMEVPKLALLRTRHLQRLAREDKHIRDIQEVLASLTE